MDNEYQVDSELSVRPGRYRFRFCIRRPTQTPCVASIPALEVWLLRGFAFEQGPASGKHSGGKQNLDNVAGNKL